ncbi:hypothetical protein GCM10010193_38840 [Kitasatospora atroaurantiaca]|uniref:Sugar lactone lactonase YvrE n=1 Tax=Kitasatospora atroaurantiaca TaxID=285545 RepID=A0A561EU89_9ACTN|nr:hypothetical protein [Kitasatospora atroaurantiaca]TWE19183.1 hypothetical protein FB465_4293 [Kitasatospora atroaurantiaca]
MLRLTRLTRVAGIGAASAALTLLASAPAVSVAPPLSDPHVVKHFDFNAGQTAENLVLEPDGSADVTFAVSRQVARVGLDGHTDILAELPAPAVASTPKIGFAAVTGIARAGDGTLYVNYATGDKLTGIWRIVPGGTPEQIAALPPTGLPNGLTLDRRHGLLYSADSELGTVWRVPVHGGAPTAWATGTELEPLTFIGANGIRNHNGAIWVANSDRGTVLRIPICPDGSAAPIETRATGLDGIDDFGFTGHRDDLFAALNAPNEVDFVTSDGAHSVVLTQQDGLADPTSVAVRGDRVYVTSASFPTTVKDPNLLLAHFERHW